jgi:hypothetical protein
VQEGLRLWCLGAYKQFTRGIAFLHNSGGSSLFPRSAGLAWSNSKTRTQGPSRRRLGGWQRNYQPDELLKRRKTDESSEMQDGSNIRVIEANVSALRAFGPALIGFSGSATALIGVMVLLSSVAQ